jgi:hypothetical protein
MSAPLFSTPPGIYRAQTMNTTDLKFTDKTRHSTTPGIRKTPDIKKQGNFYLLL